MAYNAYSAYSRYQEQSIMTMTPGERVVRLFEECEKQLSIAVICIDENNIQGTNNALLKTQRIINYLRSTLDHKYQVSKGLASLYDFFISRLIEANIKKSKDIIEEIMPLITELRETFQQGERLARIKG